MITTVAAATAVVMTAGTGAATASAPHEPVSPLGGRPHRAAAERTEQLYAEFGRTVGGLCRALLRDAAEAEDAAQQTFLSAHRALMNGSRPREPAAWLAAIARNECWARIRTRMREPLPSDTLETSVSGASDPVAEALRRADLAALWAAIGALPAAQRDALLLREFGGLSYEELAAALAVSEPAVESLLFRARRRLRVQLRAAFAALTGASWLDAVARLLAGGSAPAAAKVAALGVGAAAIGSGAAVVPQVFDNHHPSQPAQVAHLVHKQASQVHVRQVVAPPVAIVPVTRPPESRRRRQDGRRHTSGEEAAQIEVRSVDDHSGPGRGGGSDDVTTVQAATTAVAAVPTVTLDDRDGGEGRDGGSSGPDGGGGGGGSVDGGGPGDGGH